LAPSFWLITDFWLSDAVTGERFPEDLRVSQTELSDGDLLILSIRYKPDGLYCLIHTPNPPMMLHWLRLAEIPAAPVVTPRLWGALLYTEADVELATYVRTHFDDLNALSGPATRIFVVERRTNWSTAKKYWRRHLEPELYRAMSTLRWLQWTPYDPHGAYEIADLLGVSAELLPCLVFFRSPEGPQHEGEKIVFRIEHTSIEYFRSLFGEINTVLRPFLASAQPSQNRSHGLFSRSYSSINIREFEHPEAEPGSHRATSAIQGLLGLHRTTDAAAFAAVRAAEDAIKAGLLRIVPSASVVRDDNIVIVSEGKGAEVTENIHIHSGNTTVINHPQDTVIQDFQNTQSKSIGIDDLARLLHLVVSSRDLTAPDRDEALESIRDLAQLDVSCRPALPDARTRLERLRSLLTTSADIAQPALEIIASLMRLFGV
jgi:hypothetical protein